MQIDDLYLGAPVMYEHKPYKVVHINRDKLGIVPCISMSGYIGGYHTKDIKYVRISLIRPIPISEIIPTDTRFESASLHIGKNTLSGLAFTTISNSYHVFLCKDSKYVDVYRLFINHKDYGINYYTKDKTPIPVISCLPVTYMHELCYLLKKHKLYISFLFGKYND